MNNEIEKACAEYAKSIAVQNESIRRLKIKSIENTLSEEHKKKSMFAIASGICFAGIMVATHFSGADVNQAIQTEIQILSSFDTLQEYLGTFTPAMWISIGATAGSLSKYIEHKKKYDKANQEFYDMIYPDIVDTQAKIK